MRFEIKRGQNEKNEKKHIMQFEKHILFTKFFWMVP
jgi:hypothetical protein